MINKTIENIATAFFSAVLVIIFVLAIYYPFTWLHNYLMLNGLLTRGQVTVILFLCIFGWSFFGITYTGG